MLGALTAELPMKRNSRSLMRRDSFSLRQERAEMKHSAARPYPSIPARLPIRDPFKPTLIVCPDNGVPVILFARGEPKVRDRIISSVAVDMIDERGWPFSVVDSPGDAVSHNLPVEHHASEISLLSEPGCNLSGIAAPLPRPQLLKLLPGKGACGGVVVEARTQAFDRDRCLPMRIEFHSSQHPRLRQDNIRLRAVNKRGVAAGCWSRP